MFQHSMTINQVRGFIWHESPHVRVHLFTTCFVAVIHQIDQSDHCVIITLPCRDDPTDHLADVWTSITPCQTVCRPTYVKFLFTGLVRWIKFSVNGVLDQYILKVALWTIVQGLWWKNVKAWSWVWTHWVCQHMGLSIEPWRLDKAGKGWMC